MTSRVKFLHFQFITLEPNVHSLPRNVKLEIKMSSIFDFEG